MLRTGGLAEVEKLMHQASVYIPVVSEDLRHSAKCALAATFLLGGKMDKATKILEALESETPANPSTDILRVWMHLKQKQVDQALKILKHRKLPPKFRVTTKQVSTPVQ
jgi:predicted Zn-dependent protease